MLTQQLDAASIEPSEYVVMRARRGFRFRGRLYIPHGYLRGLFCVPLEEALVMFQAGHAAPPGWHGWRQGAAPLPRGADDRTSSSGSRRGGTPWDR